METQTLVTTAQLLGMCGLRNQKTIYWHILKGTLTGRKRSRTDGGLEEWVFEAAEAERFAQWFRTRPKARQRPQ